MSSSSAQKQQRHRINNNNNNTQQSRNSNAYFNGEEYRRRSSLNRTNYWNYDCYMNDYYYPISSRRIRKGRSIKSQQIQNSTASLLSSSLSSHNNYRSYYNNIPPRHRRQNDDAKQSSHMEQIKLNKNIDEIKLTNLPTKIEQIIKPTKSASSSTTNSDVSNHVGSIHRKELHVRNLAAAAVAARQQNTTQQINLSTVQALMNSLILQQQSTPSQSTLQLQYQLTNALLGIMIQQRLKETALQAQAQQIQAALPSLLATQALVCQQQQQLGQLTGLPQPILPPNIAHPGTKFNNRPLVKFSMTRSTMSPTMTIPIIRPSISTNLSRHRLVNNSQQVYSTTHLPTYQQVQEIERGISLDEAIHLKGAIDITDMNNDPITDQTDLMQINNDVTK